MKSLVISSLYERPGKLTGQVVHRQCIELSKAGVSIQVICPILLLQRSSRVPDILSGITAKPSLESVDGIDVIYVPYWNIPHGLSPRGDGYQLTSAVRRALTQVDFSPDLIHAHRVFPTAYASLEISRDVQSPLLVTVHGSDIHTNPRRNRGIRDCTVTVLRNADTIVTVSESLAEEVRAYVENVAPEVVYFGVDTEAFRQRRNRRAVRRELGLPEEGIIVGSVSRIAREKGVHELIEAFASLDGTVDVECWLLLVGDGPAMDEVTDQVKGRGLQDRVFMVGSKSHDEVPNWLSATDIFVLASEMEGLPNSILEAMSSGLPIVATSVGGIPEVVKPDCGRLVPPGDVRSLTCAMAELIGSAQLRVSCSHAARQRIEDSFSWSASTERMLELYEQLLVGQRGVHG